MSEKMNLFGMRLKELRQEKGLTQAELGSILGCIDRNVQKMEYGRSNVPIKNLIFLADYFDVSLEYLIGRSDNGQPPEERYSMEKIKDLKIFSQHLKDLRKEKGMKQREMAELLKKTERHYQDIEAGKINIPTLMLIQIADFFEVSLDYLVGRTDQR